MKPRPALVAMLGLVLGLLVPCVALLSNPNRADSSRVALPRFPFVPAWVRQEAPLEPAWPDQQRFSTDGAYQPVVAGSIVLYTSSRHDQLTAVERETGQVRWRFTADGPVRFAPAVWQDRVYCVSDDGHLYCLHRESGQLAWKLRGGPSDRRILGNERLISTWPARGAPVVAPEPDGEATVYFAAGIWPFMGVFLHAVDARSGEVRWQNSGDGSTFIKQPHQADAFAGFAPQGQLVVAGDRLLVPCGRSVPACYDRHTGRILHFRLADVSKLAGGPELLVAGDVYLNGGAGFDLATGAFLGQAGEVAAVDGSLLYSVVGTSCRVFDLAARPRIVPVADKASRKKASVEDWMGTPLHTFSVPRTTALTVEGGRLLGTGPGVIYAVDLPTEKGKAPTFWKAAIDGIGAQLDGDGDRLVVSTRDGRILAFGTSQPTHKVRYPLEDIPLPAPDQSDEARLRDLQTSGAPREGYAVLCGGVTPGFLGGLLRQTRLHLIVLEPDAERCALLREALRRAGIDGKRACILPARLASAALPAYLASTVLVDHLGSSPVTSTALDRVWDVLRPYGGLAVLRPTAGLTPHLDPWMAGRGKSEKVTRRAQGELTLLQREGALPGAADWTHQHADAANTRVSRDGRVKAPLGLLWFGGPGNQGILPRHGHGPVPQVCDGRLVIEGPDRLRAIDIYTGRLLWETALPGVGAIYDNTAHQPGANAAGSNYVTTSDGVYVAYRNACLRLDPATGKTVQRFSLPPARGSSSGPEWSFMTLDREYLVGGDGPLGIPAGKKNQPRAPSASKRLTVFDRRSGKVLFRITAQDGFRHNAIILGGPHLFAIDRPLMVETKAGSKEKPTPPRGRLVCYDLRTGKEVWTKKSDIFGTWLSYSAKHDIVVEAGLMSRDTLADEPAGMRAYRADTGAVLWHNADYFGPALIHGDRILKGGDPRAGSGTACDLRTGRPSQVADPLSGNLMEWKWVRTYGCNTPAASEHLVLFRSGAAGFYDLANEGGTGNFGGFRSSCTLNLIAAGGLLTVPDFTRSCTCSYQQQCSVGLVPMPEAEMWTFTTARPVQGPIRRLGVNLGAPGSRRADNGSLWLEYPTVGGPSPRVNITSVPAKPDGFRMHSSRVDGSGPPWVGASGLRGLEQLRVSVDPTGTRSRRYLVRLVFLEPDAVPEGARLFDVLLQGKAVLQRFDVRQQAGASQRVVVREFPDIAILRDLRIELRPCPGAEVAQAILSGVEIVEMAKETTRANDPD